MFNRFSLTRRFWTTVFVFWMVFTLAMAAGISGLMQARDSLNTVHSQRMATVDLLNSMVSNFYETRIHILLSFQHDPNSLLYELHDHPIEAHLNVVKENTQADDEIHAVLAARDMSARESELFRAIMSAQSEWGEQVAGAQERLYRGDFSSPSMQDFLVAGRTQGDAALKALTNMQHYQFESANHEAQLAEQRYRRAQILFALIVLLGALPVTGFMLLTLRRMSRGFQAANETAKAIAQGDLTLHITPDGRDEVTELLMQSRAMQQNLRQLISDIHHSAAAIANVSARVADGSLLLSDRTDQQAASLEETSAATEELTSTVQQNAANAGEAESMADQAAAVARRGGDAVHSVVSTMTEISDASHKISDIVGIIDGIAFQTNILALNAAVEAARAGEQGRGFAVVAAEVRALAQRSAAAAQEVKDLVDNSVEVVSSGSAQVHEAGQTMAEIVSNNERMMVLICEIAAASQEQSIGLGQINQAITLMDDMTHQNVTLVEQTTAASGALRTQADVLVHHVAAFRLGDTVDVLTEADTDSVAGQTAAGTRNFGAQTATDIDTFGAQPEDDLASVQQLTSDKNRGPYKTLPSYNA